MNRAHSVLSALPLWLFAAIPIPARGHNGNAQRNQALGFREAAGLRATAPSTSALIGELGSNVLCLDAASGDGSLSGQVSSVVDGLAKKIQEARSRNPNAYRELSTDPARYVDQIIARFYQPGVTVPESLRTYLEQLLRKASDPIIAAPEPASPEPLAGRHLASGSSFGPIDAIYDKQTRSALGANCKPVYESRSVAVANGKAAFASYKTQSKRRNLDIKTDALRVGGF